MRAEHRVILHLTSKNLACLYKNLNLLLTLCTIDSTIYSPLRWLSIMTPKYFTWSEAFIIWLLHVTILHVTIKSWTSLSFLLGPNKIHSVFPRCSESLLSTGHSEHCFKTEPNFSDIACGSLCAKNIALSSAYKTSLQSASTLIDMSFTYMRKRRGPKMLPWGTPQVTRRGSDKTLLIWTNCFLSQRYQ